MVWAVQGVWAAPNKRPAVQGSATCDPGSCRVKPSAARHPQSTATDGEPLHALHSLVATRLRHTTHPCSPVLQPVVPGRAAEP